MRAGSWDPWQWCSDRGIEVITKRLIGSNMGEWWPDQRHIVLPIGLTAIQEMSVLTHECGHAFNQHRGCHRPQEQVANAWAADKLVTAEAYEAAEGIYGLDLTAIACELRVMEWVVIAWRKNEEERRRWSDYFERDLIA